MFPTNNIYTLNWHQPPKYRRNIDDTHWPTTIHKSIQVLFTETSFGERRRDNKFVFSLSYSNGRKENTNNNKKSPPISSVMQFALFQSPSCSWASSSLRNKKSENSSIFKTFLHFRLQVRESYQSPCIISIRRRDSSVWGGRRGAWESIADTSNLRKSYDFILILVCLLPLVRTFFLVLSCCWSILLEHMFIYVCHCRMYLLGGL